jgi:hypothetical protein
MRIHLLVSVACFVAISRLANAAGPPVELEIVTDRGVQITAPQEWLQLLAGIGIDNVRVRGGQGGDESKVVSRGTARAPSYHVVGILNSQNQLRLPGGTFSKADRVRLKDYFAQLSADGTDAVTAPRLRFGLTEKELTAVLSDLSQPIDFETKGITPQAFIDRLQTKLSLKPSIDSGASEAMRAAIPAVDELRGVAAGTAFAIMLRNAGMVMRPEKKRGQPVVYRVVAAGPDVIGQRTLGHMTGEDMPYWPIGWESDRTPGELAPSLFQSRNAEIDGYSLEEALGAIGPLLKTPMFLDRAALKLYQIDPAKLQVKLAPTRTTYKRVVDRIISQAHLGSQVRVDEAGMPFLWITR